MGDSNVIHFKSMRSQSAYLEKTVTDIILASGDMPARIDITFGLRKTSTDRVCYPFKKAARKTLERLCGLGVIEEDPSRDGQYMMSPAMADMVKEWRLAIPQDGIGIWKRSAGDENLRPSDVSYDFP